MSKRKYTHIKEMETQIISIREAGKSGQIQFVNANRLSTKPMAAGQEYSEESENSLESHAKIWFVTGSPSPQKVGKPCIAGT